MDGQQFLINTVVDQPVRSALTVVGNWTAELTKRGHLMRNSWFLATAATASFLIGALNIPASQAQTPSSPAGFHLLETTIDDVRAALQSRQATCRALVELYLK